MVVPTTVIRFLKKTTVIRFFNSTFSFFFKNSKGALIVLQNSCIFFCESSRLDATILTGIISKGTKEYN
jgi:hypothetical protein